jgi:hypothetical protein
MTYLRIARSLPLLVFVLALTACGDDETPTSPTPTPPTSITETFSGTLTRNGGVTHTFSSQASGSVTVTVTSLAPDSAALVGISLGTWNAGGGTCQMVITKDNATQGTIVTGGVSSFASLCVRVYDPAGIVTTPISYELSVVHP